jgi:glycosyltransferase involved in cell wall biosynthesis
MSIFFQALLDAADRIASAVELSGVVSEWLAGLQDLPGWTFNVDAERPAIAALAGRSPDILVQSVYVWNNRLAGLGRRPRSYHTDLFAMKRAVAEGLEGLYPQHHRQGPNSKLRVAVFVPWLPNNPNNNILRVLAGYVGGLRSLGVEAVLVLTNEMSFPEGVIQPLERSDPRPYRRMIESVLSEHGSPATALHIASPPFVDEGNLRWHLQFLDSFRPDVVFFPNFEMSCAHIHGFGRSAATVYLQTSVRNRPPYDFTRYLYLGARRDIDSTHINRGKWYYHTFGYGNFGTGAGLLRTDIGVAEAARVVVTAGNRLEVEVNEEFASIMKSVMTECPDTVWLLLGVKDEAEIRKTLDWDGLEIADRVICKGYVREIGDYLSLSDIYANPRRTGGAVSMALAVYGQTPVLSFHGNDACNFLIDEMMHETVESYRDKLLELITDQTATERVARAQGAKFAAQHTIEASSRDLLTHFEAALADRFPR